MLTLRDDTIAAVATPPGPSACGMIRLSGPHAFSCVRSLLSAPSDLSGERGWYTCEAELQVDFQMPPGQAAVSALVPVQIFVMPAPRSYTREDVVELFLPGSPAVLQAALRSLCKHTEVRPAGPGEFTFRAFLKGRLDLGQAEAVERIVTAQDEGERKSALSRLTHRTTTDIHAWKDELLQQMALVETAIDFEEEELDTDVTRGIGQALARLAEQCTQLAASAAPARVVREGIHVVLAGLTNAGKSSLANALTGTDEALVSNTPSTTRDRLVRALTIAGIRFDLEDTPGFDPEGEALGRAASERSLSHVQSVPLICLVVDRGRPLGQALATFVSHLPPCELILVLNKSDTLPALETEALLACLAHVGTPLAVVEVSAREKTGLGDLRRALRKVALGDMAVSHGGRVSAREAVELAAAAGHCREAVAVLQRELGYELVAEELRSAHTALSLAVGEGYAEDVLESIFSRFCIGK